MQWAKMLVALPGGGAAAAFGGIARKGGSWSKWRMGLPFLLGSLDPKSH